MYNILNSSCPAHMENLMNVNEEDTYTLHHQTDLSVTFTILNLFQQFYVP